MARTVVPPGETPVPLMNFTKAKSWFEARATFHRLLGVMTDPVLVAPEGMWLVKQWLQYQKK